MRKTFILIVLLILIPVLCISGTLQEKHKAVIAKKNVPAGGPVTILGEATEYTTACFDLATANKIYLFYRGQNNSGASRTLDKGYAVLSGCNGTLKIKMVVFDMTDSNNGTLVETSSELIPAAVLCGSAALAEFTFAGTSTLTAGHDYGIGFVSDTNNSIDVCHNNNGTTDWVSDANSYSTPTDFAASGPNNDIGVFTAYLEDE